MAAPAHGQIFTHCPAPHAGADHHDAGRAVFAGLRQSGGRWRGEPAQLRAAHNPGSCGAGRSGRRCGVLSLFGGAAGAGRHRTLQLHPAHGPAGQRCPHHSLRVLHGGHKLAHLGRHFSGRALQPRRHAGYPAAHAHHAGRHALLDYLHGSGARLLRPRRHHYPGCDRQHHDGAVHTHVLLVGCSQRGVGHRDSFGPEREPVRALAGGHMDSPPRQRGLYGPDRVGSTGDILQLARHGGGLVGLRGLHALVYAIPHPQSLRGADAGQLRLCGPVSAPCMADRARGFGASTAKASPQARHSLILRDKPSLKCSGEGHHPPETFIGCASFLAQLSGARARHPL